MKKIISVMLSAMLLLGVASAAYAAGDETQSAGNAGYTDLKTTNWAYEAVNAMSGKGIIKGYGDGSFKPSNIVTYGEFIKMALIAATGEDVGNAPSVNEETGEKQSWAKNYYDKALELGYFGQTDIKDSQLSSRIPRSDMALVISNILGETKIDNYSELEESLTDINADVKNDYDIIKVYASGIITGYEDSTFRPENTLTRAESAAVIYRLTDESKRVLPDAKKEEPEQPIADNTEKRITVGYKNSTKTFDCEYRAAKLGDYGIAKFEITEYGYVAIYSTVKYDIIRLIIDNTMVTGFGNVNGTNYWEKDGYYVYFAEPEKNGIDVKGKTPMLSFAGIEPVVEFTDVTL